MNGPFGHYMMRRKIGIGARATLSVAPTHSVCEISNTMLQNLCERVMFKLSNTIGVHSV
jgi:hypothetical protein